MNVGPVSPTSSSTKKYGRVSLAVESGEYFLAYNCQSATSLGGEVYFSHTISGTWQLATLVAGSHNSNTMLGSLVMSNALAHVSYQTVMISGVANAPHWNSPVKINTSVQDLEEEYWVRPKMAVTDASYRPELAVVYKLEDTDGLYIASGCAGVLSEEAPASLGGDLLIVTGLVSALLGIKMRRRKSSDQ
ncbi:MAG: hypothetical protein HC888_11035 [Candidatus Competibacteraceae bacterium]|nr:hypothetical protein [Candidatus Competibacteraceae bacterium]